MDRQDRTLDTAQVRAWYDNFGRKQDSQDFYAGPALDALVAHADFEHATHVFEFGCGTGHFARRLFEHELSAAAHYTGVDVSPVMVGLAAEKLRPHEARAQVIASDGGIRFPLQAASVDRVVSNYVLDLMSDEDARTCFAEARRCLVPGGKLCLVSLGEGNTPASRLVCALWSRLFRWRPTLVGGCRPIRLLAHVDRERWRVAYHETITAFGVPSEVCVLERLPDAID